MLAHIHKYTFPELGFTVFCRTQTGRKADTVGGFDDFAADFLSILLQIWGIFVSQSNHGCYKRAADRLLFQPRVPVGGLVAVY